jgi:hypothetical protein
MIPKKHEILQGRVENLIRKDGKNNATLHTHITLIDMLNVF